MKIETGKLNQKEKHLHEQCNNRLINLWNEDPSFNSKYKSFFHFQLAKFQKIISDKGEKDDFAMNLYNYMSDVFYQGYYLGLELFNHSEVKVEDFFFEQPNGILREQVYDILNGATGDLIQILSHNESAAFESELIQHYQETQDILLEVKKETACFGAFQCFLDEREVRKVLIKKEPGDEIKGIIARSDDFFFVDPQKFLFCLLSSPTTELWELRYWSGYETRSEKLGQVHVSLFKPENINENYKCLPFYQGYEALKTDRPILFLTIHLQDRIRETERLPIVAQIIENAKIRNGLEYHEIKTSIIVSNECYQYIYDPLTNKKV